MPDGVLDGGVDDAGLNPEMLPPRDLPSPEGFSPRELDANLDATLAEIGVLTEPTDEAVDLEISGPQRVSPERWAYEHGVAMPGAEQARVSGAAEEASFGLSDEMRALGAGVAELLHGEGSMESLERAMSSEQEAAQEQSALQAGLQPGAYLQGRLSGVGATMAAPGAVGRLLGRVPMAAKAAQAFPRVASMAGGASLGALESAGRGQDVTTGAVVGAAPIAGLEGAGALLRGAGKAVAPMTRQAARSRIAATGAYGGDIAKLEKSRGAAYVEKLAKNIEKHMPETPGIPKSFAEYEDAAQRLAESSGPRINEIVRNASKDVEVDMRAIGSALRKRAAEQRAIGTEESKSIAKALMKRAKNADELGAVNFERAHIHRRALDKEVYNGLKENKTVKAEASKIAATVTRQHMDDALRSFDPATRAALKEANEQYATAADVMELAGHRMGRESGNLIASLSRTMGAGLGGAAGAAGGHAAGVGLGPGAVAGMVAMDVLKKRGKAASVQGWKGGAALSKMLGAGGEAMAPGSMTAAGRGISGMIAVPPAKPDLEGYAAPTEASIINKLAEKPEQYRPGAAAAEYYVQEQNK